MTFWRNETDDFSNVFAGEHRQKTQPDQGDSA
jgi:hypothetical protein